MKRIILATVFLFMVTITHAQRRSLDYLWLNQPCAAMVNCNTGCSACDLPGTTSSSFFGTNMIWIGTAPPCPYPITTGDNALYVEGWSAFVTEERYGMISALATMDMNIDSVIIVHRRAPQGPERLKISYNMDASEPFLEATDVEVTQMWNRTVLLDLGCITVKPNSAYGFLKIKVQPYQGSSEAWQLDEIRIVGSPCAGISTGVDEHQQRSLHRSGVYYDVLGRPVDQNAAPGVYNGNSRVVKLP